MNIAAVVSLGAMGLAFGAALAIAAKKLAVETDPRESKVLEALPGANCGGCGYPGCAAYAAAVVSGGAEVDRCPAGGDAVRIRIAEIMGVSTDSAGRTRRIAFVKCLGDREACPERFSYDGIPDCRAANLVGGGHKSCRYGCLGLGTCVAACLFDAMHMSDSGLPVVDREKCVACGKCVEACPRGLIELFDEDIAVYVACSSKDKGADVRKICKVGCIGCGICAKNCPASAITVADFLARVDQEKCTRCGICAEKCPTKCIVLDADQVRVGQADSDGVAVSADVQ